MVDVRTILRVRHNPHFNRDTLPLSLKRAGIAYIHMAGLGGLRHARPDSSNIGWHNPSFRGFADYMQTVESEGALGRVAKLAMRKPAALKCVEAVPSRCHRSLIADALIVRALGVAHITNLTRTRPYSLTPFPKVRRTRITYPQDERFLLDDKSPGFSSVTPPRAKNRRGAVDEKRWKLPDPPTRPRRAKSTTRQ